MMYAESKAALNISRVGSILLLQCPLENLYYMSGNSNTSHKQSPQEEVQYATSQLVRIFK